LLIPVLINHTANDKLGSYFLALSFSVLASIFVNFGTSQTAVVEIKKAANENEKQTILAETLALRFFPLSLAIIISCVLPILLSNGIYYLLVLPIVLAEFINPQFYLIAIYKIKKYALFNLILRSSLIIILILLKDNKNLIEITLVGTGLAILALNIIYLPSTFLKVNILSQLPSVERIKELYKTHVLVVGNGLTVHLQQSMFLFALPSFVTPIFLSAYGLIDKLGKGVRTIKKGIEKRILHKKSSATKKKERLASINAAVNKRVTAIKRYGSTGDEKIDYRAE
jgi:O-antigen/teichoic acid export membrane protein